MYERMNDAGRTRVMLEEILTSIMQMNLEIR